MDANNTMDAEIRAELEESLRAIYDDDDFVICTAAILGSDRNAEKMLGFIYAAAEAGDEVTHDDALRLALILKKST